MPVASIIGVLVFGGQSKGGKCALIYIFGCHYYVLASIGLPVLELGTLSRLVSFGSFRSSRTVVIRRAVLLVPG